MFACELRLELDTRWRIGTGGSRTAVVDDETEAAQAED